MKTSTKRQLALSRCQLAKRPQNSAKGRKIPLLSRWGNWAAVRAVKSERSAFQRHGGNRLPRKQRKLDGARPKGHLFSFVWGIKLAKKMTTKMEQFKMLVDGIADNTDTDFFLYSESIYDAQVDRFITSLSGVKNKRTNAALILCTNGGSADAGYQLARCIKKSYKKFTLYVFGNCKSAGTLIAVGADDIVMSSWGQFGPLDVQLADKDEFYGQTPALDVSQSITTLSESAFNCFIDHFLKLEPGRGISTKTAVEIAKSLTLGIIEPIASQIDPLLLGRVDRSMKIAEAYIQRLNSNFKQAKKLIGGYPSHEFVIDFEEANQVFGTVREPTEDETKIEIFLRDWDRVPKQSDWIGVISTDKKEPAPHATGTESGKPTGDGKNGGAASKAGSGVEANPVVAG